MKWIVGLAIALVLSLALNGAQARKVILLRQELKDEKSLVIEREAQIRKLQKADADALAKAAAACAVEGDSAFDRGVRFGKAVCEARQ